MLLALKPYPEQYYIDRLEKIRWKGQMPVSPYDPTSKVYELGDGWYKCKNTGKRFNVRTGTVFQDSNLKLWQWFYAFELYSKHKRGISAHELTRFIDVDLKTADLLLKCLRDISKESLDAMFNEMKKDFKKLSGIVEMDETSIYGRRKNKHWDKKDNKKKIIFWGAVERKKGGRAIAQVVLNTRRKTLEPLVRKYVEEGSKVNTDENPSYNNLGELDEQYNHKSINHSAKQYSDKDGDDIITTNTIESLWAFDKRIINGTYYHISEKYAPDYLNEMLFRYNTRNYSDEERFNLLLTSAMRKKYKKKQLIKV